MAGTEVQEQVVGSGSADDVPARATPSADPPTIDWSGRSLHAATGGDGGADPGSPTSGGSGTRRLATIGGIVALAYIAWVVIDLVVFAVSGTTYTAMHKALGSLGFRLVLCAAWLALLHHGLDGLRVIATEFAPRLADRDRVLRGAVAFAVLAIWIPTALVLVWPAIRSWFAA